MANFDKIMIYIYTKRNNNIEICHTLVISISATTAKLDTVFSLRFIKNNNIMMSKVFADRTELPSHNNNNIL